MVAFDSPSMIALIVSVAVFQGASLLFLALNLHAFRRQRSKDLAFLRAIGDETAMGTPGRFVVPSYLILTICSALGTLYLFIFPPHIL